MNNLQYKDGYLCVSDEEKLHILNTFNNINIPINYLVWRDRCRIGEYENYPILVWYVDELKVHDGFSVHNINLMTYRDFMTKAGYTYGTPRKALNKHSFVNE